MPREKPAACWQCQRDFTGQGGTWWDGEPTLPTGWNDPRDDVIVSQLRCHVPNAGSPDGRVHAYDERAVLSDGCGNQVLGDFLGQRAAKLVGQAMALSGFRLEPAKRATCKQTGNLPGAGGLQRHAAMISLKLKAPQRTGLIRGFWSAP